MLVLTRRVSEQLVIDLKDGRTIRITVNEIHKNGQIKLGFEADPDIRIFRKELAERIERGEL